MAAVKPRLASWFVWAVWCVVGSPILAWQPTGAAPTDQRLLRLQAADARSGGTYDLAWSPDGSRLATRSNDQRIQVWDAATGDAIRSLEGHQGRISDICFSHDGRHLLSTSAHGGESILVWDVDTGRVAYRLPFAAHRLDALANGEHWACTPTSIIRFRVPPDGARQVDRLAIARRGVPLALSGDLECVSYYIPPPALSSRAHEVGLLLRGRSAAIRLGTTPTPPKSAVWVRGATEQLVLHCHRDSSMYVCAWRGASSFTELDGHQATVEGLTVSPDQRHLASASSDGVVRVWETLTWQPVLEWTAPEGVMSVQFSPDGRRLACGLGGESGDAAVILNVYERVFASRLSTPSPDELWLGLAETEPRRAYACLAGLRRGGGASVELLRERLGHMAGMNNPEDVTRLVDQLDDPRFSIRSAAMERLAAVRDQIRPQLEAVLAERISVEKRFRLQRILEDQAPLTRLGDAERRQVARAIFALELIGGPDAQALLEQLATRHADPDIRTQAAASWRRLSRKSA